MLARWYLLLGQFSVTFEYQPGSQHSNADGMSRQCGQCRRPDCPVSAADLRVVDPDTWSLLVDKILQTVRSWVQSGNAPLWPACAGLSPELRSWRLQVGNLTIDSVGRLWRRRSPPSEGLQLLVPVQERHELIRRFHYSLFARHLGVTRTIFRLFRIEFIGKVYDKTSERTLHRARFAWRGSHRARGGPQ